MLTTYNMLNNVARTRIYNIRIVSARAALYAQNAILAKCLLHTLNYKKINK